MDPLFQIIIAVATLAGSVGVALLVGGRKGLSDLEAKVDSETKALIDALERRVRVLTDELAVANGQIATLQGEVAQLRTDLREEQRITARMRPSR